MHHSDASLRELIKELAILCRPSSKHLHSFDGYLTLMSGSTLLKIWQIVFMSRLLKASEQAAGKAKAKWSKTDVKAYLLIFLYWQKYSKLSPITGAMLLFILNYLDLVVLNWKNSSQRI